MSGDTSRTVLRRYGPDPAKRFYQLDEKLLWDPALTPTAKLILIDFFHRLSRGLPVPSREQRAVALAVSPDTLDRAESDLIGRGFLLKRRLKGLVSLYLAAYPAIPPGHEERKGFEADFRRFCDDELPENAAGSCRTSRQVLPHIAATSAGDTLYNSLEQEEEEKKASSSSGLAPPTPELTPYQQALRLYREWENPFSKVFGPGFGPGCNGFRDFIEYLERLIRHDVVVTGGMLSRAAAEAEAYTRKCAERSGGRVIRAGIDRMPVGLFIEALNRELDRQAAEKARAAR